MNNVCNVCQVQLANKYEGRLFNKGLYSRKFDGKRMYTFWGIGYSRTNKQCRFDPISHILNELTMSTLAHPEDGKTCFPFVTDGEVLYFEPGFKEDFKRTISLTSRMKRLPECDNLYYVIFDIIEATCFSECLPQKYTTLEAYQLACKLLEAKPILGRTDLLQTNLPHVLIAVQTENMEELTSDPNYSNWEGLMYRNAEAKYEYKRSKQILKIKQWKDIELPVVDFIEGKGKHEGRLGAVVVKYKNDFVSVGSGFVDQEREAIWSAVLDSNSELLQHFNNGNLYIKIKYFEESHNANGGDSLRFPIYQCFRLSNMEEFVIT